MQVDWIIDSQLDFNMVLCWLLKVVAYSDVTQFLY
jgi:hypothetical protein